MLIFKCFVVIIILRIRQRSFDELITDYICALYADGTWRDSFTNLLPGRFHRAP